jgi:para-nitrobenzyl esterase
MTASTATVETDRGNVRGLQTGRHNLFQGIPYAAPPTGELRWAAPRPADAWAGVRDATQPGAMSPQQPSLYARVASLDEDCLFLNVTVPRSDHPALKPVMVWIHGDGAVGAGNFFDARRLATLGDVVVVTFNYRLGIFGAFGHPELADSGTYGLQDQQAALGWVRRNAEAFGGEPRNVTVFGESYGGLSTAAHLVSPGSAGLLDRAIIQSGFALMDLPAGAFLAGLPAVDWFGWRTTAATQALGASVASQLGCGETPALDCLRRVPVQDLLAHAQAFQPYAFGNAILLESPAETFRAGRFQRVPVLTGATRDEHRLFVGLFRELAGQPITADEYPALLEAAFSSHANRVLAQYPLADYASASLAWATLLTDRMWARSTFELHKLLADRVPVYAYEFADRAAPMYLPFPAYLPPGAFHAADVPYVFPDTQFEAHATAGQRRLSDQMLHYWDNFAHTGDPNGPDLLTWRPFDSDAAVPFVNSLAPDDGGITAVDYAAEHKLDFWAAVA